MLEHGIEWEQKGEHKEHLSVLEFKWEKRKEELAELEQTIDRVQQKQVSVQAVEQIEAKPLPTVVEAHIHMVLFCNPASTIVDALKSYLNKKHMKAVVWDRHCNSRAEVENAVEYAMRQSRKVRPIDYDRKDVLSVDEWGYYEAVERAEGKIKDNMAFTKSEPEQTPETLENKSVSSISDTPETLTYKSIKYNYLYYYIVPTSYTRSIIKAQLQNIIYYGREFKKFLFKNYFQKCSFKSSLSLEKDVVLCYNKENEIIREQ